MTITNALNYNSSTYMNPMSHITDDTPNAIRFAFGTDYQATSWNRHVLSITPEILMHVKFKLLNCQNATDFLFTNIAQVSNVDFYTTSATVNALTAPIFNFDIITYKQPTNLDLCPPPHIDKFSPQTITAGTESILTISGTGFGNVRGNSQVQFPNSKDGGTSRLQFLDDIDYVSWSDTEIKIKIPSTVQNGNSSNGQLGSGLFLVNKANAQMSNQIAVSPTDLIIKYSIRNDVLGTGTNLRKIPFRFVNRKVNNTFYTREFYLDKSITQDPLKVKIIKKALQDWSCATGINWGVIGEVDAPLNAKDGKSIISFQDMSPSTALAKTYSYSYNICTEGVSNSNEFATLENNETDIVIYKNSTTYPTGDRWFLSETMTGDVPTGKFDFYHVISHELGHAHHLDHVIDKLDLMHYAETPGILSASRTFVKNSLNSIDGGSYIIDKSYLINSNLTNCSSITPLVLYSDDCNGIAKISEINSSNNLQEYPNPFENKIFISYEARNNESIGCSVVDLMGKKVFEKSLKNQYQGLQNEEIDLSHLNSGMYMLELLINGEKEVIKITKK